MKKIIGIAIAFAAALGAQTYNGSADVTNCSILGGWAWDGTNNAVSVDVYDNGVPLLSSPANVFRQDLLNADIGNGYHGYNIATPGSLKDGKSHTITIYFGGTSNLVPGGGNVTSITCTGGPAISTITPTRSPASTRITVPERHWLRRHVRLHFQRRQWRLAHLQSRGSRRHQRL